MSIQSALIVKSVESIIDKASGLKIIAELIEIRETIKKRNNTLHVRQQFRFILTSIKNHNDEITVSQSNEYIYKKYCAISRNYENEKIYKFLHGSEPFVV